MTHFQAGIQGNRGPATRLGTVKSGIYAFARGRRGGAYITMWEENGEDYIRVAIGSHHNTGQVDILYGPVADLIARPPKVSRYP